MAHEEEFKGPKLTAWGNMITAFTYLNYPAERELDFFCVVLESSTSIKGWKFQEGRQLDRRVFGFLKTKWAAL